MNTASCESQITYIDGDEGILRYRGYPIEQLAEHSTFLEVAYLLIHGALPDAERARRVRGAGQPPHAGARGLPHVHGDVPAQRAPDGRHGVGDQRAVHVLPGVAGPVRPGDGRAGHGADPGQDADHHVVRAPRVQGRAAAVPGLLARVRRGLPADDVRGAVPAVRGRPGRRGGARPAAHPARRPRAELLHVDGAHRRLQPGQPVRVGRRRHQRAVRPAARRRQRGRAEDAHGDPGRRRRRHRTS